MRTLSLLPLLALLLLLTACGRPAGGARYVVEGLQVFYVHADGTQEAGPCYCNPRTTLVEDGAVRILDWNEAGVLLEIWEPVRSEQTQTTSVYWSIEFWSPDFVWPDGEDQEGLLIFYQSFLGEDPDPDPLRYRQPVLSGLWVAVLDDGGAEPTLQLTDLRKRNGDWEIPLAALSGTQSACTALAAAPDSTLKLCFEDGTQIRFDPQTGCLLSDDEAVPEPLPEPTPEVSEDAEGWSVSSEMLLKDGSTFCSLWNTFIKPMPIADLQSGMAKAKLHERLREIRVLGATEEFILLAARYQWLDSLEWKRRKWCSGTWYTFILSAEDGTCLSWTNDETRRTFVMGGEVYSLGYTISGDCAYSNGWRGPGNASFSSGDGLSWYLYRGERHRSGMYVETEDDLLRAAFGEQCFTGAMLPYGDALIFAFEDGSIRSFCPGTGEVRELLPPDAARGCIWRLGLDGNTLCWYELFQQGGQMHTLELLS